MQDLDILGAEGFFLFFTLLKVFKQSISSSICLALLVINPEVVVRELLGPANLSGAQTLRVYETTKVNVVGEYKHLMLKPF